MEEYYGTHGFPSVHEWPWPVLGQRTSRELERDPQTRIPRNQDTPPWHRRSPGGALLRDRGVVQHSAKTFDFRLPQPGRVREEMGCVTCPVLGKQVSLNVTTKLENLSDYK